MLLSHNAGNLPLIAKPLFGVLSDTVYIGRAHRLPYIPIGGSPSLSCLLFRFSLISVHARAILLGILLNLVCETVPNFEFLCFQRNFPPSVGVIDEPELTTKTEIFEAELS
jgi:hypothetical protein